MDQWVRLYESTSSSPRYELVVSTGVTHEPVIDSLPTSLAHPVLKNTVSEQKGGKKGVKTLCLVQQLVPGTRNNEDFSNLST